MKFRISGDWLGLSFGVFVLAAAIVAIPAGEWIGGLLVRPGNAGALVGSVAPQTQTAGVGSTVVSNAVNPAPETGSDAGPSLATRALAFAASTGPSLSSETSAAAPPPPAPANTTPATASASSATTAKNEPAKNEGAGAAKASGTLLQIAAVMREESARSLAESLKKKGYPVFVKESRRDALYRVQVGPYPDRQGARVAARSLQADGFDVIVIG
jgi:cell division septation protein DedD